MDDIEGQWSLSPAETIAREVVEAVSRWRECASQAGVIPEQVDQIARTHRLDLLKATG
jgi:hypothetical protein